MLAKYLYPLSLLPLIFIYITQHIVIPVAIKPLPYICFSGSLYILFSLNLSSVLYYRGLYSGRSTPVLYIWIGCALIIYKAIYNNTFLDKEVLYSQCIYTDNKGVIYLTSISLINLWRPLYSFIIFIIYLVCIFLLKPLDLGNFKSQYKVFHLFYYFIYNCYIICLASLFYPKA